MNTLFLLTFSLGLAPSSRSCLWQLLPWCFKGDFLFLIPSTFINWNSSVGKSSNFFCLSFAYVCVNEERTVEASDSRRLLCFT